MRSLSVIFRGLCLTWCHGCRYIHIKGLAIRNYIPFDFISVFACKATSMGSWPIKLHVVIGIFLRKIFCAIRFLSHVKRERVRKIRIEKLIVISILLCHCSQKFMSHVASFTMNRRVQVYPVAWTSHLETKIKQNKTTTTTKSGNSLWGINWKKIR